MSSNPAALREACRPRLPLLSPQVRDGARPAVDGCSLTGNGEYGLRLQDAGGTYNGNVVAANAKGSVAYTLLDDEVGGRGCGGLSPSFVFGLTRLLHACCMQLRCAAPLSRAPCSHLPDPTCCSRVPAPERGACWAAAQQQQQSPTCRPPCWCTNTPAVGGHSPHGCVQQAGPAGAECGQDLSSS